MPRVIVIPQKVVYEVEAGKNLKEVLEKNGHYIKCSCGAVGKCGDCVIKVPTGELSLSPMTFKEQQILGNVFHVTRERLSCQCSILDDVTIDISEQNESRDNKNLEQKTRSIKTKLRTPEEKKARAERLEERQEKTFKKQNTDQQDESWFKHWEKKGTDEQALQNKKGKGGLNRPKHFEYTPTAEDSSPVEFEKKEHIQRPAFKREED